jgi:hypothetical protein
MTKDENDEKGGGLCAYWFLRVFGAGMGAIGEGKETI